MSGSRKKYVLYSKIIAKINALESSLEDVKKNLNPGEKIDFSKINSDYSDKHQPDDDRCKDDNKNRDGECKSIAFYAFMLKKKDVLNFLLYKGACPEKLAADLYTGSKYIRHEYTLPFAVLVGNTVLVKKLLASRFKFDVIENQVKKIRLTSLMTAILSKNEETANILMPRLTPEQINVQNYRGRNALMMAYKFKFFTLAEEIRKRGGVLPSINIPANESMHDFRKRIKKLILDQGPINDRDYSTVPSIVESVIYSDDQTVVPQLKNIMHEYYKVDLIKPIMDVIAVAALGYHEYDLTKQKEKKLKIFVIKHKTLQQLMLHINFQQQRMAGIYTHKNTIFCSTRDNIVKNILHESTHFVMHQIFNNYGNPFFTGAKGKNAAVRVKSILDSIKQKLPDMIRNENDAKLRSALYFIKDLFDRYDPEKYAKEMVATIPEIMGYLGPEVGSKWLEQTFPELIAYYKEVILPAIEEYMQGRRPQLMKAMEQTEEVNKENFPSRSLSAPARFLSAPARSISDAARILITLKKGNQIELHKRERDPSDFCDFKEDKQETNQPCKKMRHR